MLLILLSLVPFLVFASRADGKQAPLKVYHTLITDRTDPYYRSEVMIPHGKSFRIICPREPRFEKPPPPDRNVTRTFVSFSGGIYSINFNNVTYGTKDCPDEFLGYAIQEKCDNEQLKSNYCTVTANDPSKKKGCSKRPLRLRFTCESPDDRAVMVSIIVDE